MFTRIIALIGLLGANLVLHGQASPTASRAGDLQIGAGYSNAASDYGPRFRGFNIYGDFDFLEHFGVEAEFHYVKIPDGGIIYEKTYEIGGRYLRTYGRFVPYGKVMVGRGVFNFPPLLPPFPQDQPRANLAYNMYALGGGMDFKARPWLNLRGDLEYQKWPGFPQNGLTPVVISVGAAYHFQ